MKKLATVALAAAMCVTGMGFAACGAKKAENELWITYFKGGYGSEWVEQLARKFEAENEGIVVKTDGDTQLINAVGNMMENGTKYDLIFCHDITWEDYVAPGQIHCLDNLYNTEVDSNGTKFADRIWDEDVLASSRYPDKDGNYHYYKVPWTIGTAGIAYNLSVMDRIDEWLAGAKGQQYLATEAGGGDTARRWGRKAPVDYYDLLQYCVDISTANIDVNPKVAKEGKITPFTWSGLSEEWQWDYVMFDWWGQLAGPETMNTFKNFGNVKDDFTLDVSKQGNPDMQVYNPEKFAVVRNTDGTVNKTESTYVGWAEYKQAYQLWYDLVVGHKSWSTDKVASLSKFDNEQAFASGKSAMTPAACWIEYESKTYLDRYKQEISIMPTPVISEVKMSADGKVLAKDATDAAYVLDAIRADAGATEKVVEVDGKKYNRVSFTSSFGDGAMIPEKATNKELAEKFLLFMQRDENAKLFTKLSGGTVLPYKYNYWEAFIEDGVDKASSWQKSIFEINRNSTKFNNYTQHPMMRKTGLRGTARMTTMWPENDYYYYKAWGEPSNASYSPATLFTTIYGNIQSRWNVYKQDL